MTLFFFYCHDLEVMSLNHGWVELGLRSTSKSYLTLEVLVATIDALGHFETG